MVLRHDKISRCRMQMKRQGFGELLGMVKCKANVGAVEVLCRGFGMYNGMNIFDLQGRMEMCIFQSRDCFYSDCCVASAL